MLEMFILHLERKVPKRDNYAKSCGTGRLRVDMVVTGLFKEYTLPLSLSLSFSPSMRRLRQAGAMNIDLLHCTHPSVPTSFTTRMIFAAFVRVSTRCFLSAHHKK